MALLIFKIKIDDLIISSYTFAVTANAILYTGAKPWFFDCDKELILIWTNWKISFKKNFHQKKTLLTNPRKKIKAIIVVQSFAKIDLEIRRICKKIFLK